VQNVTPTCPESYPAKVSGTTDVKETVTLHGLQQLAGLLDGHLQFPEILNLDY
jgi:hypothetical protein